MFSANACRNSPSSNIFFSSASPFSGSSSFARSIRTFTALECPYLAAKCSGVSPLVLACNSSSSPPQKLRRLKENICCTLTTGRQPSFSTMFCLFLQQVIFHSFDFPPFLFKHGAKVGLCICSFDNGESENTNSWFIYIFLSFWFRMHDDHYMQL